MLLEKILIFYILYNFYFVHTSGRSTIDTTPEELEPFPVYQLPERFFIHLFIIFYILYLLFCQKIYIFVHPQKNIFSSILSPVRHQFNEALVIVFTVVLFQESKNYPDERSRYPERAAHVGRRSRARGKGRRGPHRG